MWFESLTDPENVKKACTTKEVEKMTELAKEEWENIKKVLKLDHWIIIIDKTWKISELKDNWTMILDKKDLEFTEITDFVWEYAIVSKNWKQWLLAKNWEVVFDYHYDKIINVKNWILIVENNWKQWFVWIDWQEITSIKYDEVEQFNWLIAKVKINWKYWLVNIQWDEITDCIFDKIYDQEEWFFKFEKDWKQWFINLYWNIIADWYDKVWNFFNWYAEVYCEWMLREWWIDENWRITEHNPYFQTQLDLEN